MNQEPEQSRSPIATWLLPSVRDIVFICLFWSLLAGPLSNRPLADVDIGWHIRNGEQMLAAHAIPRTDSFSSTMHGQPWFAWEWLYDLLLGVLHRAGGLNAVVWLAALIISATLTLLLSLLIKRGTGLSLAIALMLLAEAASSIHMFARPHIVSWLLVLLWFAALDRWESGSAPRWLPWLFPVSMLFWVNLHGSWLLGLALLAIYAFASLVDSVRGPDAIARIRAGLRARAITIALLTSAAATFINPYGWRLHAHIYRYLTNRYLMDRIVEFRSPDFHGWAQRAFAIILLLALAGFAGSRRKLRLSHLLVALLASYAGLFATRNLPVSSMLLVLVAGPVLWETLVSIADRAGAWSGLRRFAAWLRAFSERAQEQELELRGHIWAWIAILAALAVCLNGGRLGSRQIVHAEFDAEHLPVQATEFLKREARSDPVLGPDQWGGYLIYRLYPERLVVIDDRHDLYGSDRFRDYLTLMQIEPGWREVLEKSGVHTLVLQSGSALANILGELPREWAVVYEDKAAVVIEKRQ